MELCSTHDGAHLQNYRGNMTIHTRLLDGKVALITGAASGIGRSTAALFAHEGARIVATDRELAGVQETVRLITASGGVAKGIESNVSVASEIEAAVAAAVDAYGRLDCAANCAGVRGETKLVADYTDEMWADVLSVNLTGIFYSMRAELRAMLAAGGGSIVNVASAVAVDPVPGLAAYVASKTAVVGITRSTAGEYADRGIRVNAVLPGRTATPMLMDYLDRDPAILERALAGMPMHRLGQPEEVAEAIAWLCSDRASNVTAIALLVDGGQHSFSHAASPEPTGDKRAK
jgi:NAD(P)-dependent dehydrogenase (short-subunit alcohol dehydrogenase family)